MKKHILLFSLLGVAFTMITLSATSCNRPKPCKVIVNVSDVLDKPLSGASVRLDCNSCPSGSSGGPLQEQEDVTDGSGKATFSFDHEAVLDILVITKTGQTSNGIIKLVPGKTIERFIKIAI
jgi:hypothetical protein